MLTSIKCRYLYTYLHNYTIIISDLNHLMQFLSLFIPFPIPPPWSILSLYIPLEPLFNYRVFCKRTKNWFVSFQKKKCRSWILPCWSTISAVSALRPSSPASFRYGQLLWPIFVRRKADPFYGRWGLTLSQLLYQFTIAKRLLMFIHTLRPRRLVHIHVATLFINLARLLEL